MKKKLIIIAVFLIASSTAFSQVKFGIGATAGSKANILEQKMNYGVNARVLIDFPVLPLAVTGGFSYFLPKKVTVLGDETTNNLMAFNADLIYYFFNKAGIKVYGLGGLNYAMASSKILEVNVKENEISWEVGAGINFGKFFVEAKYDGNLKQVQGFAGIYF